MLIGPMKTKISQTPRLHWVRLRDRRKLCRKKRDSSGGFNQDILEVSQICRWSQMGLSAGCCDCPLSKQHHTGQCHPSKRDYFELYPFLIQLYKLWWIRGSFGLENGSFVGQAIYACEALTKWYPDGLIHRLFTVGCAWSLLGGRYCSACLLR